MDSYKFMTVPFEKITMGQNVRLPKNLDIESLAASIEAEGLKEPITVWSPNGGDHLEVVKGHRRNMALAVLKERNNKRFKELFKEGVPVYLAEGISLERAIELKCDHSDQRPLTDPYEIQLTADLLFDSNHTEKEVSNNIASMVENISPMKADSKKDLAVLEAKLAHAIETGAPKLVVEDARKAVEEFIAAYRRGFVQNLKTVWQAPSVVRAALFAKANDGVPPEGFKGVELPLNLTQKKVKDLVEAHKKDVEILSEDGTPAYNKDITGPNFGSAWKKVCESYRTSKDKVQPTRKKAMSASDMEEEIKTRWVSKGFCLLTRWHCGNKDVEGLSDLDKAYQMLDLIQKEKPELFAKVVEEGLAIKKAKGEEARAKAAAEEVATAGNTAEAEAEGTEG